MSKRNLLISPVAQSDLTNIHRYSRDKWGSLLADKYLDIINDTMWHLVSQPYRGKLRSELGPNIRSLAIRSHNVFYLVSTDLIQIVRALHDSQDPNLHLSEQNNN